MRGTLHETVLVWINQDVNHSDLWTLTGLAQLFFTGVEEISFHKESLSCLDRFQSNWVLQSTFQILLWYVQARTSLETLLMDVTMAYSETSGHLQEGWRSEISETENSQKWTSSRHRTAGLWKSCVGSLWGICLLDWNYGVHFLFAWSPFLSFQHTLL